MTDVGLFIGGVEVAAMSGESFETRNPATGDLLGTVEHSDDSDVDRAVAAARDALAGWAARKGAERGRIMARAAQLLRERNDELARLEVLDTGKPIAEASVEDVISGAECIEYFVGAAATIAGESYDLGGSFAYTRREPVGVCVWASARGTTPSRSRVGSRHPRWPAVTRWCSSRVS